MAVAVATYPALNPLRAVFTFLFNFVQVLIYEELINYKSQPNRFLPFLYP